MTCKQYLSKKLCVGFNDVTVTVNIPKDNKTMVFTNVSKLESDVYTWYGSAVIRQFFQDQLDDQCSSGDVFVGIDVLEVLLQKCMLIDDHPEKAEEELPEDPEWLEPEEGNYGPTYMEEIRATRDMLIAEKQSGSFETHDYYFFTDF